jgi:hypothetical protein
MKFYKGDTVKVIKTFNYFFNSMIGKTGVISMLEQGEGYPYFLKGVSGNWCDEELELVSRAFGVGDTVRVVSDYQKFSFTMGDFMPSLLGNIRVIKRNDYEENAPYIYEDTKGYCWKTDQLELVKRKNDSRALFINNSHTRKTIKELYDFSHKPIDERVKDYGLDHIRYFGRHILGDFGRKAKTSMKITEIKGIKFEDKKDKFFNNLPRYLRPRKVHITPSRSNITVFWKDGTTTNVTAQKGDRFDVNMGFGMALMKKVFGNCSITELKFKTKTHNRKKKIKKEETK